MAIIGIFTLGADGKLTGSLRTLTLSTKLQFVPETNKTKDSAPDFRVYLDKLEVGAAWKKVGRESGREYWSVKLDDPAFAQPGRYRGQQDLQPTVVTPQRRLITRPKTPQRQRWGA
jgi:uncharacterized protein (DUF736 family)